MREHYCDRLADAIGAKGAPIVIGIDPLLERLPANLRPLDRSLESACAATGQFCAGVIDAVAEIAPCVKINSAFFEAFYDRGVKLFFDLVAHAHRRGLLVISDVKRGDIGSTARLYARGHLDDPAFDDVDPQRVPDAVTLAGYLGENAVAPFADAARRTGRGLYVLVRPSDRGADRVHEFGADGCFYEHMAGLVRDWGAGADCIGRCGLSCVGAVVAPKDAASTHALRAAMPRTPWLVPGYGAQGASAWQCAACFLPGGAGALINASRSVIYAFERDDLAAKHGADWRAAVAEAAREFAADVRGVLVA